MTARSGIPSSTVGYPIQMFNRQRTQYSHPWRRCPWRRRWTRRKQIDEPGREASRDSVLAPPAHDRGPCPGPVPRERHADKGGGCPFPLRLPWRSARRFPPFPPCRPTPPILARGGGRVPGGEINVAIISNGGPGPRLARVGGPTWG